MPVPLPPPKKKTSKEEHVVTCGNDCEIHISVMINKAGLVHSYGLSFLEHLQCICAIMAKLKCCDTDYLVQSA
jgi:hypothetical protein